MKTAARRLPVGLAALLSLSAFAQAPAVQEPQAGKPGSVERGRYLARIAGCNDCHTRGYAQSGGKVPENQWLTGDGVGWSGPWGTTYPQNLRLAFAKMSEQQWLEFARGSQTRPPMPWFALRDMSSDDLRALYRFVRYLGPAGEPAPSYVPPGRPVNGPIIRFPE